MLSLTLVLNAPAVPGSPQPAVIDLGQVVDAIMIGDGGKVQFNNLTLQNPAPRNVLHTDTHARYKIRTFGPWPSITILPNATVSLTLLPCCQPSALVAWQNLCQACE